MSQQRNSSNRRYLRRAVWGYAAAAFVIWIAVQYLVDRVWPVTLFAFGPRWVAGIPLLPLGGWALVAALRNKVWMPLGLLALTACVVVFGIMDVRLGLERTSAPPQFRVMTHNLGGTRITAEALDRVMRKERIDVAALQECPFFDNEPAQFGWTFFYGGNLCLVSRFPFTVLDESNPDTVWQGSGREPMRFQIDAPVGSFELLNVHLPTIREGIEGWTGIGHARSLFTENRTRARQQSLRARTRIRTAHMPVIVAGDFNLPAESAIFRAAWGDLVDVFAACGRGVGHTKFTPAYGVRIDHLLTSEAWRCSDAYVLPDRYDGDHAPLVAALRMR